MVITTRRFLVLTFTFLSVLGISVANMPTVLASPPTSYMAVSPNMTFYFYGDTPDIAAENAIAYWNSSMCKGNPNCLRSSTGSCSFESPLPGWNDYSCPILQCAYGSCGPNIIRVYPLCGDSGATWTGIEFVCPPEPDCDGPAR
jgi:hypothetical protein